MTDLNLEHVDPHDPDECADGMNRLRAERDDARRQRDSARMWGIEYERENLELKGEVNRLTARLVMHEGRRERIELPAPDAHVMTGQDEIGGVGV